MSGDGKPLRIGILLSGRGSNFIAIARVPLAIPERSIGRKSGSICTTTIEPNDSGLCFDTNG